VDFGGDLVIFEEAVKCIPQRGVQRRPNLIPILHFSRRCVGLSYYCHPNSAASTKLANLSNMIGKPALHSWSPVRVSAAASQT
jgi:hypothetical protein